MQDVGAVAVGAAVVGAFSTEQTEAQRAQAPVTAELWLSFAQASTLNKRLSSTEHHPRRENTSGQSLNPVLTAGVDVFYLDFCLDLNVSEKPSALTKGRRRHPGEDFPYPCMQACALERSSRPEGAGVQILPSGAVRTHSPC